jgi:hypothetical protein
MSEFEPATWRRACAAVRVELGSLGLHEYATNLGDATAPEEVLSILGQAEGALAGAQDIVEHEGHMQLTQRVERARSIVGIAWGACTDAIGVDGAMLKP